MASGQGPAGKPLGGTGSAPIKRQGHTESSLFGTNSKAQRASGAESRDQNK